ncbi:translation initiation factor IF-2 [Echinops telfairi]|uniref:Translation initiation factor IF-2 n=1 Tax=Echinops telfairi TaxID=9371 RepID=A0ABM1VM10_ECHTE|nr:translation initiation factor IF-2 [Echinops telfairi]
MPQGEGPHTVRGGAPGCGAGRGAESRGTSKLVPEGGGATRPGVGLDLGRGGAWVLEEEPEQLEGGASGLESKGNGARTLEAGLQPVAAVLKKGLGSVEGGAPVPGAGSRSPKGGAKEPSESPNPGNGLGRPREGGLRGGGVWGRGRPRTPPGEVVWVERTRGAPETEPVWVPRRPPRAQSWGGAPGGGTGPSWGEPPEDRSTPEPHSGDVWVPRGRPPAAGTEVWVCWAGGSWVWREWGRPVSTSAMQPERVWTLRKGSGGN